MASIVVNGDTSGSITLSAPAVAGSSVLTLPAVTDTVAGIAATQTLTNKTLTSPTLTTPNINSAQVDTVSGTAPLYFCRAWVNFNGTGTVAIRASGNVSSITDNGIGYYTVNFTTAMPDANYDVVGASCTNIGVRQSGMLSINSNGSAVEIAPTTSAFSLITVDGSSLLFDSKYVSASIFR